MDILPAVNIPPVKIHDWEVDPINHNLRLETRESDRQT